MFLAKVAILTVTIAALASCAMDHSNDVAANSESLRNSNSYHLGYSDGCQVANFSGTRQRQGRNAESFDKDAGYRKGFLNGTLNCKDTVLIINTGKRNDHLEGLF